MATRRLQLDLYLPFGTAAAGQNLALLDKRQWRFRVIHFAFQQAHATRTAVAFTALKLYADIMRFQCRQQIGMIFCALQP